MKKRVMALVAVFSMLMTFTACGGKNESNRDNGSNAWQNSDRVMEIEKTPDKDLTIWEVLPEIPETPAAEFEYKITDDGVKVTGYKGTENAVRVPETIEGKPVVSVRFEELGAEEIILPRSLKKGALWHCTAKYVNVPCDDMTISGGYELEKVYIEDNVTVISASLLARQDLLEQVRMCSNIKVIEKGAFQSCDALRELEIPEGVEYIADAFRYSAFTKITLPNSLVGLHKEAFVGASDSTEIVYNGKSYSRRDDELYRQFYPNDLLIYNNVVMDCWDNVSEITIPEGVTEIGDYSFSFQKEITKITLPSSVRVIHDGAFNSCEALSEIVIPEGVEELGALIFDGCKSLKKIDLPDSISLIDGLAFADISYNEDHAFIDFEVTYKGVTYDGSSQDEMLELYRLLRKPWGE